MKNIYLLWWDPGKFRVEAKACVRAFNWQLVWHISQFSTFETFLPVFNISWFLGNPRQAVQWESLKCNSMPGSHQSCDEWPSSFIKDWNTSASSVWGLPGPHGVLFIVCLRNLYLSRHRRGVKGRVSCVESITDGPPPPATLPCTSHLCIYTFVYFYVCICVFASMYLCRWPVTPCYFSLNIWDSTMWTPPHPNISRNTQIYFLTDVFLRFFCKHNLHQIANSSTKDPPGDLTPGPNWVQWHGQSLRPWAPQGSHKIAGVPGIRGISKGQTAFQQLIHCKCRSRRIRVNSEYIPRGMLTLSGNS